jgi:DNA polymerase-1
VNRDTRGRAKTINFAISTASAAGAWRRGWAPAPMPQAMIDRYFERFPGIQRYIHETLESVRALGYSGNPVRPQDVVPAHQFQDPGRTPGQ